MTAALDPAFVAIARALYGDAVDPGELAKSLDAADVHIDGPVRRSRGQRRREVQLREVKKFGGPAGPDDSKKGRKTAAIGLGASGVATVAGVHALTATRHENAARLATLSGDAPKLERPGRIATSLTHRVGPKKAAAVVGGGLLALHAVELAGDGLAIHAQSRALKRAKAIEPVAKGRLSLKPVNSEMLRRIPTLRAVRPAGSPAVQKSMDADFEISKVDTDQHLVFGWLNVSKVDGKVVRDRQGDEIDIEELEKSAYDYVLDSRVGGDQHERIVKADGVPRQTAVLVESMVFTPEKIEKLGLPEDFPQGWWGGYKVQDDGVWEDIKKGKRTGFSVHGTGRRTPIEKRGQAQEAADRSLRTRARQAKNPPPVRRQPTDSSAIASLGYQRQTRKLDVEMRSRPGEPYSYRVKPEKARRVLDAPSKGKAYTAEIRGQTKHHTRYTAADRARLFLSPVS